MRFDYRRAWLVVAACVSVSCGGKEATETQLPDAGVDAAPAVHRTPPPRPDGRAPDGTGTVVFAVSRISFGDVDADGHPDEEGWKHIGFDLDGAITAPGVHVTCRPYPGANASNVQTDGDGGIDNSWGYNFVPLIVSLTKPSPSIQGTDAIRSGAWTWLLQVDRLGAGSDQTPLRAVFLQGKRDTAPTFDGHDVWDVAPESLINGEATRPIAVFPESYVAGDTWVSGRSPEPLTLLVTPLVVPSRLIFDATMVIHAPVITLALNADRSAGRGVLAGHLITDEFNRGVCAAQLASCCSAFSCCDFEQQFSSHSDFLDDATQPSTARCDSISIGVAFDVVRASIGGVAASRPTPPCADGGTGVVDSGSDGGA